MDFIFFRKLTRRRREEETQRKINFFFVLIFQLYFLSCHASSPLESPYIYHSVNVIAGEYCELDTDLTVRRSYASENPLGWQFSEEVEDRVTTPDGQWVNYSFIVGESRYGEGRYLNKVETSSGKKILYTYSDHPTDRHRQITKREENEGRYLTTEYYRLEDVAGGKHDPVIGKVKLQKAPVGPDGTPVVISRYFYYPGYTEVLDALGNKSVYRFHEQGVLTAIENYERDGSLYRAERFVWNDLGQITSRWIEDGEEKIWRREDFVYDLHGNVVKHTLSGRDSNDSYTTLYRWSDDDKHLLLYQAGDNGLTIRYEYNEDSNQLAAKFLYDRQELRIRQFYVYDEDGKLVETIVDDGSDDFRTTVCNHKDQKENEIESRYDIHGNKVFHAENGVEKRLEYDFSNRLIRKEEKCEGKPLQVTTYRYDYAGNLVAVVDPLGNERIHEYDTFHRLIRTTFPQIVDGEGRVVQPTTTFSYDILDRVVASTDLNGHETKTEYNIRGKPTKLIHPDGTMELFEYTSDGALQKSAAKNGVTTLYERDFLSRVVREEVHGADGTLVKSISREYAAFHLVQETDLTGKTIVYEYDEAGRQTAIINGMRRTEITYDAEGQVVRRTENYGESSDAIAVAVIERDAENKLSTLSVENAHGVVLKKTDLSAPEKVVNPIHYSDTYNELGQNVLQTFETTPKGLTVITTFDALQRPRIVEKKALDRAITRKEIFYDPAGNKTKEIYSLADYECSWTYGPNNRLESAVEGPNKRMTFYFYNDFGELETIVKPDGVSLHTSYTPSGKLERQYSSDGTIDYTYVYDEHNRLVSVTDHVHNTATSRSYNTEGRVVEEQLGNGLWVGYDYDLCGRRTGISLPDGSSVVYTYDAVYLRSVKKYSPAGEVLYEHQYKDYSLSGKIEKSQLIGSAGELSFCYDAKDRLKAIKSAFWNEHLERNGRGRIESIQIEDPSGTTSNSFSYDNLGQLTEVDGKESICYDSIYRRVDTDGSEYRYDSNGNLISEPGSSYTYDALNRLVSASKEDGYEVHYTYDYSGRRLSSIDSNGNSIRYLYDGQNEIGSVDEEGRFKELRVLGNGLGSELGAAIAIELEDTVYAPVHDHRGSVVCLVDAQTGEATSWYRYAAFGESECCSENKIKNPWKFASKREDETGLIYFAKRYYHPKSGQWTTCDPLGCPESINRHCYALNDPINRIDPTGLFSFAEFFESVWGGAKSVYHFFKSGITLLQNHLSFSDYIQPEVQQVSEAIFGTTILNLAGFYNDRSEMGVHGNGELNDKVRITLINGILNARIHYKETIEAVSEAHGGINVHYVLNATDGWTWDLLKGILAKGGWTSPEAHLLAQTWKGLIEEMGGVDGGGLIIHYAHSLGGTHTNTALRLLSPEERKMIRIYTFGSPTAITNCGAESVMNYMCVLDGICLLDPIGYFSGLFELNDEIASVGSWLGIPFMDHPMTGTYLEIIKILGQHFLRQYG